MAQAFFVQTQPGKNLFSAFWESNASWELAALPLFDPWLLAHGDTDGFIDPRHRKAVYRTAGWISPVLLRQGRVVATWSHRRMADGWVAEITPLARLSKGEIRHALGRLRHLAGGAPVRLQTG